MVPRCCCCCDCLCCAKNTAGVQSHSRQFLYPCLSTDCCALQSIATDRCLLLLLLLLQSPTCVLVCCTAAVDQPGYTASCQDTSCYCLPNIWLNSSPSAAIKCHNIIHCTLRRGAHQCRHFARLKEALQSLQNCGLFPTSFALHIVVDILHGRGHSSKLMTVHADVAAALSAMP